MGVLSKFKLFLTPVYFRGVPCNVNARISRKKPAVDSLLRGAPIHVVDVGCRGGATPELEFLSPHIALTGFDADANAVAELNRNEALKKKFRKVQFLPYCIGTEGAERMLHITKVPSLSSFYLPSPDFIADFQIYDKMDVVKNIALSTTALTTLRARAELEEIDFLKLDTQGNELEILKTAPLAEVGLIEVEVEFWEMYQGQPLFHDVDAYLYSQGFRLLYLNRSFESLRRKHAGYTRGITIFAEALYVRDYRLTHAWHKEKLVRVIVLLANYGYYDYAEKLAEFHQEALREHAVDLDRLFASERTRSRYGVGFVLVYVLDWALYFILRLRRWNRWSGDNDRGYPHR